jgi:NADPH-dependent glutamate synthase beta subunit-like oxidoreductase
LLGDDEGKLQQIEFIRMELGEPDDSGRRRPVPVENSETRMDVDVVIAAIGQKPLTDWYTDDLKDRGLQLTRWNTIVADAETLQSDVPHIFTGGDLFSGPALLVDAVGTGRRAARSIHRFFNGQDLGFPKGTYAGPKRISLSHDVEVRNVAPLPHVAQPELSVTERVTNFEEVDLVLTPDLVQAEANRCMRCGTLCYFTDPEKKDHVQGKGAREKAMDLLRQSPA